MDSKSLSVVVPVFNEERTVSSVLSQLMKLSNLLEVVVVDDGSSDRTAAIVAEFVAGYPCVRLLKQSRNRGKTEALKRGFAETKGDIVIVQDADLEYDPADISEVIHPILEGRADVVYGSRFLVRRAARVIYFYHYIANRCLTLLSNLFTNLNMTDIETGYKAFRGDIIRSMAIASTRFGFEIEVTAKISKLKCAVYEVPISYYGRTYDEGKKIGFRDGMAALWYIFRFNVLCSPDRCFHTRPADLMSRSGHVVSSRTGDPGRPLERGVCMHGHHGPGQLNSKNPADWPPC